MCWTIWNAETDSGTIETPRELGALVGADNVIYYETGWKCTVPEVYWWEHIQDTCLCSVDIRETLTAAGILWEEDDFPGDVKLIRAPPPAQDAGSREGE